MNLVVVLCAGDMIVGPQVVGVLANYFGERPLSVFLWDANSEKAALMQSLAEVAFLDNGATHTFFDGDLDEALASASVILRCAGEGFAAVPPSSLPQIDLTPGCLDNSWPRELTGDPTLVPHQLLRWIRADDPVRQLTIDHENSPLIGLLNEFLT